jgi:hypothetical protein
VKVDFEDGRVIKSSFITKDEHEAFKLTRAKLQQQNERQRQRNRDRESRPPFWNQLVIQMELRVPKPKK